MMIATTPVPAPANEAAPTAATTSIGAQPSNGAADDFMALLEEMVTSSASATTSGEMTGTVATADSGDKDGDSETDLASLVPMVVPPMQLELPKDIPVANADAESAVEALLGTMAKSEGTTRATRLTEPTLASSGVAEIKPSSDLQPSSSAVTFADALTAHRPAQAPSDSPAQVVNSPVGSPQWREEVGARVSLMVQQGNHSASLKLSPEHLGPLEVRISVQNDQASVWFGAAHADTRAAIEHALPRLRELFASQGLSLADAGVFREPPREQPKHGPFGGSSRDDSTAEPQTIQTLMIKRLGLVDAYA